LKIEQAIRTAANFDWPQVAAVFFDLYDDLHRRFRKLYDVPVEARATPAAHPNAS
jgi:hypothetical protein